MAAKIVLGLSTYLNDWENYNVSFGRGSPYTEYLTDFDTNFDTLRTTINAMIDEIKAVQGPNAGLGIDILTYNDYTVHTPDPVSNGHIGLHSYQYTNNGTDIDIARGDYLLNGQKVSLASDANFTPSVATNPQYIALDINGAPTLEVAASQQEVDIYQLTIAAGPTITAVTRLTDIFFDGDEYENMRDRPASGTTPATFGARNYEQFYHRVEAIERLLSGWTSDSLGNALGQPAIRPGSVGQPGLVIIGATDTGIYGTTTTISMSTASVNRFTISSTSLAVAPPLYPNGGIVLDSNASPAGAIQFGADQDASIYYNGTDLLVTTNLQDASDLVLNCGTDKTLELTETVWDDLRVPLLRGLNSSLKPPAFLPFKNDGGTSVGTYAWQFADQALAANEEQMWFDVQLPHRYKEGTDIYAHIHWAVPSAGAAGLFVKWGLEYNWQNVDGTFGNTTIITSDAASAANATTSGDASLAAYKHYVTNIGTISGAGKNLSSMLVCRLFRNSSHATDDYTAGAFGLEVDFHFEIDTLGSRQPFVK